MSENNTTPPDTGRRNIRLISGHFLMPGNPIINIDRVREAGVLLIQLEKERAALKGAIRRLQKWGGQAPLSREDVEAHRREGYRAFDHAREVMRHVR